MNRIFHIMFFTIVLYLPHYSPAQDDEVHSSSIPSTAVTEVHIVNRANRTLRFDLRPIDGRWGSFEIESGDAETFDCSRCDKFEFLMRTKDKTVNYILESTRRYVLEWNNEKQLWDLFHIQLEDQ